MPRRSPALLLVHVVWATHGRRPLLPPAFDGELASLLGRKAQDSGCVLLDHGFASDHVHMLLRLAPSVALSAAVQRLKGATSFDVNRRRRLPVQLEWQAGYWAESLGPVDRGGLATYLRDQRLHHDDSHPNEQWLREWESAEGGL